MGFALCIGGVLLVWLIANVLSRLLTRAIIRARLRRGEPPE